MYSIMDAIPHLTWIIKFISGTLKIYINVILYLAICMLQRQHWLA